MRLSKFLIILSTFLAIWNFTFRINFHGNNPWHLTRLVACLIYHLFGFFFDTFLLHANVKGRSNGFGNVVALLNINLLFFVDLKANFNLLLLIIWSLVIAVRTERRFFLSIKCYFICHLFLFFFTKFGFFVDTICDYFHFLSSLLDIHSGGFLCCFLHITSFLSLRYQWRWLFWI